jgi:hypothetical protein
MRRLGRTRWKWLYAIAAVVAAPQCATAFYWCEWPGSRVPRERTVLSPGQQHIPGNPPPHVPIGPPVVNPPVGPPNSVPEPGTALAALLGLGAMAGWKALRKKR